MTKLKSSAVTQEAWSFTLHHFSTFIRLAALPFLIALTINSLAMMSFLQGKPVYQALIDGLGGLIEAFWGIRWFHYVMKGHQTNRMEPFRFGKQECLYFIYSFILLVPFMVDDFLFVQEIKRNYALGYVIFVLVFITLSLRFEFIFSALALKRPTGFFISWKESQKFWWALFKSYSQSFMVLLPVACLGLLGLGIILIVLWSLGILHFEGWTMHQGWEPLLNNNPSISILYVIYKEGLWFVMQAFTMVIAARYYTKSLLLNAHVVDHRVPSGGDTATRLPSAHLKI